MKKVMMLVLFVLITLMLSVFVMAVHIYPDYDPYAPGLTKNQAALGFQPTADISNIIYCDYDLPTGNPLDLVCKMFEVEAENVRKYVTPLTEDVVKYVPDYVDFAGPRSVEPGAKSIGEAMEKMSAWVDMDELTIYYYCYSNNEVYKDVDSIIENADIALFSLSSTEKLNKTQNTYSCFLHLYAKENALLHLEESMLNILDSINTPQMLFEVCGKNVPDEYFDVKKYHNAPLTAESFEVLGGSIGATSDISLVTGRYSMTGQSEIPACDYVYLTYPWSVKLTRDHMIGNEGAGTDPIYDYRFKAGVVRMEMTVNYAPSEGMDVNDYLNYCVDNIELSMIIYNMSVPTAPETGFTTAMYAAAIVISAAAVVAVRKKRR